MIKNENYSPNIESFYSNLNVGFLLSFCSSPLFPELTKNSTFSDSLTPCLTFVFLPIVQLISSLPCFLFLISYGCIVKSPKLLLNKILISKLLLAFVVFVSAGARLFFTFIHGTEFDKTFPEEKFGVFCYFLSIFVLFFSEIVRYNNGILSSIWLQICWTLQLCFALVEYTFGSNNYEVRFENVSRVLYF